MVVVTKADAGLFDHAGVCPFQPDGAIGKTGRPSSPAGAAFERRTDGTIMIRSFRLAREVLRSGQVRQAGFNAELAAYLPQKNASILFKDGDDHRRQRSAVARFFAPTVVMTRYRRLLTAVSQRLIDRLETVKHLAIDEISLELSVAVAAEIVGLTDSLRPGLDRRLGRFFEADDTRRNNLFGIMSYVLRSQINLLWVYILDVRPAIRARRRDKQADLISQLLEQGWSSFAILVECVTYATAGMSTTREFIVAAAWHLLENANLREAFLAADEAGKAAILEELLRLDPAVTTLFRKATAAFALNVDGVQEEIAAGTRIAINVRDVNADPALGACSYGASVGRSPRTREHLSFGDGAHRCPGATLAIQEASTFLDCLLRVPGIKLDCPPRVGFNETTTGYVLRGAIVSAD